MTDIDSDTDINNPSPSRLVLYSASWCPDCRRTKAYLDGRQYDYLLVDIGKNTDAFIFIEKLTRRVRIPTLIFPDGSTLVEPDDETLAQKLGER
jgi:glutaredoxin